MTQFCKTIGLILVAAGFLPAFGRTVAWYRLDGFAPGEKTTADTVIENIADPGHLQGKCYTCTTANTTYGTDANGMPYGMPGLNGAFGVLDPVTGEWSARTNTMHFGLEKGTDYKQVSGNWVADGSTVKVTTDSRLALSNITVEVIFRAVSDFPGATWNFAPLVMLNGQGGPPKDGRLASAGKARSPPGGGRRLKRRQLCSHLLRRLMVLGITRPLRLMPRAMPNSTMTMKSRHKRWGRRSSATRTIR